MRRWLREFWSQMHEPVVWGVEGLPPPPPHAEARLASLEHRVRTLEGHAFTSREQPEGRAPRDFTHSNRQ